MILYVHRGKDHKGKDGETLVNKALVDYSQGKYKTTEISREEKGKPFFEGIPVHFSISHSEDIWVCLMADFQVGIDIQVEKEIKYVAVSKRFFSKEEAEYVAEKGKSAFFNLWTMKEAYVKYTGKGFSGQGFAEPSLMVDGNTAECFIIDGEKTYFKDISSDLNAHPAEREAQIYGFVCTGHEADNFLCKVI